MIIVLDVSEFCYSVVNLTVAYDLIEFRDLLWDLDAIGKQILIQLFLWFLV